MCSVPEDLVPGVPGWGRVLLDTLETAVGEDLHGLDDDVVLGLFDVLETVDRLSHALRFGVLAELDVRRLTDTRFGHVVSNAAGWRHGADPRRVRRDLKCAKTLRRALPDVAAALAEGTISVDRAKVLAAAVNERNTGHLTEAGTRVH